ncbi:hypothetical protein [Streptomyces sp. NPDC059761]|uniref:hypothetical protein n=1 Tax=Streptomyces sp. NPDC059761 TaxID=3346937 RepID=UPI00364AAFEF
MGRLESYDDDSIVVGIVPRPCGACGTTIGRLRLSLDTVLASQGDFVGIRTVGTAACCGDVRSAPYPAVHLAALLEHLQDCPNH